MYIPHPFALCFVVIRQKQFQRNFSEVIVFLPLAISPANITILLQNFYISVVKSKKRLLVINNFIVYMQGVLINYYSMVKVFDA